MTIDTDITSSALSSALAARLAESGASHVLTPDNAAFATELTGFNLAVAHAPAVAVVAESVRDVRAAVTVARDFDIPLHVIGHGHGFPTGVQGGIAVTTRRLAHVSVDAQTRTATVAAGSTWQDVLDAAAPHGLAPLCGSAPHVGVMGYLLGGGLGPVARTFGFAADHVRELEVVTGQGEVVVATAASHPELFWALRGGKTGFGVLTRAVIDLMPVPTFHGGGVFYAAESTEAVLREFASWSTALPESVSASIALLRLPPLPELPEPIRGRFVVHLRLASLAGRAETDRILAPMLAAGRILMAVVSELPYSQIGMVHSDPVAPMPVCDGGILLRAFTPETVRALLDAAGPDAQVPLAAVEVRVLGGALSRQAAVPNAVGGREAAYSLHVVGAPVPELLDTVIPAVIGGVFGAVEAWATGTTQINFVGGANGPSGTATAWSPEVRSRLDRVRAAYDPEGLFRA